MMPQTCPGSVISPGRVRSQRRLVALLVGLALSVGMSLGAQAATTWTVCASGCDHASIKAAIAAPTTLNGDTLAISAGTYTEAGITVDKSLTLQGESVASTIVQAAASKGTASDRVFTIPSGVTVTLQALTVRYGRTTGDGGGLANFGTLTLMNSTIRGNQAAYGGGLYNHLRSTLTLINSTVSGNAARNHSGGGLNEGTLTLMDSTVSGNTARNGSGGGLGNGGTLTLMNSTVSGNTAQAGGGLSNGNRLTVMNSIVANNLSGGDCRAYGGSSITSMGYNLASDWSCQLFPGTDWPATDPVLGPLHYNGGRTTTHALLPGSPAIDAIPWGTNGCGTTLFSDQRWQARAQPTGGACDIGAYEVEVAGQALGGWVTGLTPSTVVCQNVTTGHSVTLSAPASPWDCEAAGLGVTPGDQVVLRVRGPVQQGATDVGRAVTGMAPSRGSCTNLTTGQQVTFHHMNGATAASCVAAGLVVQAGEAVQMRVQGVAE
jgi:hypothetical protein